MPPPSYDGNMVLQDYPPNNQQPSPHPPQIQYAPSNVNPHYPGPPYAPPQQGSGFPRQINQQVIENSKTWSFYLYRCRNMVLMGLWFYKNNIIYKNTWHFKVKNTCQ